jgi:hypothetical protein
MAKLVDALPSGGSVRKDVQVRILFWALQKRLNNCWVFLFYGTSFIPPEAASSKNQCTVPSSAAINCAG